jgi:DNA/RNA endonuclease G (NUC1)
MYLHLLLSKTACLLNRKAILLVVGFALFAGSLMLQFVPSAAAALSLPRPFGLLLDKSSFAPFLPDYAPEATTHNLGAPLAPPAFTAGDLVVYRVGDGSAALGSTATAVFVDEYTPAGTLVQSIAMPTAVSGSNKRLTASGSATNEGFLTRSSDGQYLALTGYDAALGTSGVAATTSTAVQRVIGRVDAAGTINTTTVFAGTAGNSFSGGGPRSVVSDAGTNFWAVGSVSGVQYITLGATSSTQVNSTATNLRGTNIFGGQLYISSGAGTIRMGAVGTGTPTSSGQTITNLPGFPATTAANGFFFADLNAGVAGVDTLYVADDGTGQVLKYSLVGGNWVANGSVAVTAARGLTGSVSGTTVTLFGTLGSTGTTLYKLIDSTGYNATISGSPSTIALAGTNKAFRGVAFAPSSGPPNQAIFPNCPAGVNTVQGTPTSAGVSATDPDGTVTSATITSAPVTGITLTGFSPAGAPGGTASATLNVANTTPAGTYSVSIQYQNNDSPTPQTATCTVIVTVTAPNQPIAPSCPGSLIVNQGSASLANVSATDPDGTVTSASIISASVPGITLSNFSPAGGTGGTASATLNVASTTAIGSYNITIRYSNNDGTPQTADCSVLVNVNVPPDSVVISQIYGGGGNTGATLKNDYIELINHSSMPVNLNGWSVQAWSFATNSWQVTPLTNVTLQPGAYYLVQESQGAGGTDNLPTPDAIGTIAVSSASTKVALVSNTTPITTACPTSRAFVDLVGYGTDPVIGTCYEGSAAAPQLSNTTAIQRRYEGCFDTDDNAADFVPIAPNPHNTASATHDCTGLSAFGSANPSTVSQGDSTTLTVRVAPAQNPASSGVTVTADLSSIGGSANQILSGSGDVFSYTALVPVTNPSGMKSLQVTVTDQSRTANTNMLLSVLPIIPDHVTISQVYGGGGNAGASYANDYVELYNPTAATVSMTGWSLQYGAATGTTFSGKQVLGGTIDPGQYYLVSLASGGAVGSPLPPASVSGTDVNMAGAAGKIVLVSNSDTLSGACPLGTDTDIVDFVGYGTTANCHEGSTNAPAPSNTTAIFRKTGGGTDTDQNGNDFVTGIPNPRSTTPVVEFGPSVAGTDPTTNDTIAPYDSSITANFSEPVDAVGVWYNVICTNTGLHNIGTVAHSNDFKTWAFTPNSTFQFGEQCTATIYKNQIHDQDTDDSAPNTDTPSADYVWSFTVVGAGQAAPDPPSVHLTMGNPSNATDSPSDYQNYLMQKPTYSLSYNSDKGTPNWVSWHLDSSWYGTLARIDTFRPDPKVDPSWYRVQAFDYSLSGFDRGHMTPNADRDNQNRIPINQETYLMSNMVPQAPDNNQGPWAALEGALRTIADGGSELYIVSGPAGVGGTGSNGSPATTVANGHVTVPKYTWKVALVLPKQDGDDISRVTCATRAIAVVMPNIQGIRNDDWHNYLTNVDAVEQLTGYDLFSNLPTNIQSCVESGVDGASPQAYTTNEDSPVNVTVALLPGETGTLSFNIVGGPSHGTVAGPGPNFLYTPNPDFNGTDSFTAFVSSGTGTPHTSRMATVSIMVNPVNDAPTANSQSVSTNAGAATPITLTGGDLESLPTALTFNVTSGPAGGVLSGTAPNLTYTPATNYSGSDSFKFTVTDTGDGASAPRTSTEATVSITINKLDQEITFGALPNKTYGDADFTVSASSPSGLPVTFAATENCTVTGTTVHITGAGACTITASQNGDASYNAALPITQGFTINAAPTLVTVTVANATYDGNQHGGSAVVNGANLSQSIAVSYIGSNGTSYGPSNDAPIATGDYIASSSYSGDANHLSSSDSKNFSISKASSTATVTCDPGPFTYTGLAQTPCSARAEGDGNLDQPLTVIFTNNNAAGDATASASYTGDANHEPSSDSKTFAIGKANAAVTINAFDGTYDGQAHGVLNGSVVGANGEAPAGLVIANTSYTNVPGGPVHWTFSNPNYNDQSGDANVEIAKADQTITFQAPSNQTFGATDFVINPAASSGLSVSLDATGSCTLSTTSSGITVHITGAASCTITATQPGDGNYNAATPVVRTFSIAKANQVITFASLASSTFGDSPITLSASGGASGNPVTFGVIGNCSVSGNILQITGAGSCTVTASQAGDANYNPAADVPRTFSIGRAQSGINLTTPPFVANGGAAVVSAMLTGIGGTPLANQSVVFTIGTGTATQTCSAMTSATGLASCSILGVAQPIAPDLPVSAAFGGNVDYLASSASGTTLVFAYVAPSGASFVIGDGNSAVGTNVTFWGAQWSLVNILTGGSAPNSFKGFAGHNSASAVACGTTWTTENGNNARPPATLPLYTAVMVSSSITKSGSTISGNTPKIVIVKTNPGYGPDPSQAGTGKVIGTLCQ